jgi:hypothetical protein
VVLGFPGVSDPTWQQERFNHQVAIYNARVSILSHYEEFMKALKTDVLL